METRFFKSVATVAISAAAIVSFSGQASAQNRQNKGQQDFDALYSQTEYIKNAGTLIKGGPVHPLWSDNNTFFYTVGDGDRETVCQVTAHDGKATVTESVKDSLDAIMARSHQRPYYDESDDSYFSMNRKPVKVTSPDGKWQAFVKDNNVWLKGTERGAKEVQLSFDGSSADYYVQLMWSPDSKKVAALRKEALKERQILLRVSRPEDQIQPKYRWLDYAKPGDTLPQETPALFDVESASQIYFDTTPYSNQYFLELGEWSPNSDYFTFEYNRRGHQLYQLVKVDAVTGRNTVIVEEKSDTFVYYYDLYRHYFDDGRHILWISERDDWRHLYMVDAIDGTIKQLTKGEWNVREIINVDEKAQTVTFYANGREAASGEDPYNKHVCRLDLATGKVTDLTPENANHQASFNRDFSLFVDNFSRPDLPGKTLLRSGVDGKPIATVAETDITALLKKGFTMPEVFVAKARDGVTDIWGTIFRPSNFSPRKKYPVVEYIYAGPHDNHVVKDFAADLRFMRLVEMGFIVVTIDGMGTDNRSKSFQDVAWRNIKDGGFEDRILWMKAAAAKYPYMDLSKVGIYGYSAGGQNTLSALLFHPEFYKVGVALCGCHDNRMDKIWWNEQWMGYPIGPWYSESSNVDNAWRLEGKLFIINGEIDDNVDPASSLQVVSELIKHNKDFDQLYLPGHSHSLGSDWITRRVFKYFWENCR